MFVLFKTISDILFCLLDLFQAHGIDHLVIPTRDYLFAPSFVDISRAVQFIHCGFFHFYLIIMGRGVNAPIIVVPCFVGPEKQFCMCVCLTFVFCVQIMQLVVKQLMFTVKLGGGGVQQLCFVIW